MILLASSHPNHHQQELLSTHLLKKTQLCYLKHFESNVDFLYIRFPQSSCTSFIYLDGEVST